ncbi:hypothetical protein [Clostridium grantii]|uniref:Uncharacterized protein n=1 Tax=Clostridium grantii DSM 8605 TaxID=1121316 RepID=A0A1M5QYT9_9CLOT|nr:hypothetical protein [Clostridium grantii]SHH19315.1 hypothetical protein SAMN02745207_00384 [Clostridium grantii DSM 8605]
MNEVTFNTQFQELTYAYEEIWWSTNKQFPKLDNRTSFWDKKRKEFSTDRFIEDFLKNIKSFPENQQEKFKWRIEFQKLLNKFILEIGIISENDKEILLNKDLIKSTQDFINESKLFNEKMPMEDIGQALRNLWIINISQLLLSKKPEISPSIFGYSMLYPYTDNYLDDISISLENKKEFNNKLARRLKGELIKVNNDHEKQVFALVSMIESQYDRNEYSSIFHSLAMIHNAQRESVKQQHKKSTPYETDILGISLKKGGASVLTDAYLINGELNDKCKEFFFGYGFLLQLCDDLQDAKEDLKNGNMTMFSQIATKYPLDNITNGLINFIFDLLNNETCFKCENLEQLKTLIRKNCSLLTYFAIARNKSFYSTYYYKNIKAYFPYTDRYMNNLGKKMKNKFSKLEESYNGTKVEDILLYALDYN